MKTVVKKVYEAMFLVDSVQAASDWEGTVALIKSILEKAEAEIISIRKWDERKLAYDLDRKSRGTYILCYFKAPTGKITQIERDVQLSEKIMRVLILKGDHLTQADMEKETPLEIVARGGTPEQALEQKPAQPAQGVEEAAPKAIDILADIEEDSPEAEPEEDKDKSGPDITI